MLNYLLTTSSCFGALGFWGAGFYGIQYRSGSFWKLLGGVLTLGLLHVVNQLPLIKYSLQTAQPWTAQIMTSLSSQALGSLAKAMITALQLSLALSVHPRAPPTAAAQQIGFPASIAPGVAMGLLQVAVHWLLIESTGEPGPLWPQGIDMNGSLPLMLSLPLLGALQFVESVKISLLANAAASAWLCRTQSTPGSALTSAQLAIVTAGSVLVRMVLAQGQLASVVWDFLPAWLFSQLIHGLVASAGFVLVYRHDLSQLPLALAMSHVLMHVHEWLLR